MTIPEIIAHRGASRECPENTLAAFRRAVELGADAVELDVQRTADGVLVVHHDAAIPGLGPISALPARRIATEGRAGGSRHPSEPIPTLAEVLDAVGDRLGVYVELKAGGTVPAALELIHRRRSEKLVRADAVALHCFDHRLIAQALALDPSVPRGVLEGSYPVDATGAARAVEARDLWRHRDFVDEALVRAAHAEGRRVIAWTVNDPAQIRRFAAWGVDGLCTDDPALARATLQA